MRAKISYNFPLRRPLIIGFMLGMNLKHGYTNVIPIYLMGIKYSKSTFGANGVS